MLRETNRQGAWVLAVVAAGAAVAGAGGSAGADVVTSPFLETFEGRTDPAQTALDLSTTGTNAFSINAIGGTTALLLNLPGGQANNQSGAASVTINATGNFTASTRVITTDTSGPLDIDFSALDVSVFAAGTNAAAAGESPAGLGYSLRLNGGFNDNSFTLELLNGAAVVASAAPADVTRGFDESDFVLLLSGTISPTGDLALSGTLTDNLNAANARAITATVPAADVSLGTEFGVRGLIGGGNSARPNFDDVAFTVTPIPEPTALAAVGVGGGLVLLRRSRRRG